MRSSSALFSSGYIPISVHDENYLAEVNRQRRKDFPICICPNCDQQGALDFVNQQHRATKENFTDIIMGAMVGDFNHDICCPPTYKNDEANLQSILSCPPKDRARKMPIMIALVSSLLSDFNTLYDQDDPEDNCFIDRVVMFNKEEHAWPIAKNTDIIVEKDQLCAILGSESIEGMFDCILQCISRWKNSHLYKQHHAEISLLSRLRVAGAMRKIDNSKRKIQAASIEGLQTSSTSQTNRRRINSLVPQPKKTMETPSTPSVSPTCYMPSQPSVLQADSTSMNPYPSLPSTPSNFSSCQPYTARADIPMFDLRRRVSGNENNKISPIPSRPLNPVELDPQNFQYPLGLTIARPQTPVPFFHGHHLAPSRLSDMRPIIWSTYNESSPITYTLNSSQRQPRQSFTVTHTQNAPSTPYHALQNQLQSPPNVSSSANCTPPPTLIQLEPPSLVVPNLPSLQYRSAEFGRMFYPLLPNVQNQSSPSSNSQPTDPNQYVLGLHASPSQFHLERFRNCQNNQ